VESTEDVVKVIKLANEYRVPVVPFSGEFRWCGLGDGADA
jgi:FAD/FMN-containing dehydrogenase